MPPTQIYGTMTSTTSKETLASAITVGYRSFDLAERYETGKAVGEGFKAYLEIPGRKRSDLWVVSKLDGLPSEGYEAVKSRVVEMLKLANLEYFDVLLIHHPLRRGANLDSLDGEDLRDPNGQGWKFFAENIETAWGSMSRLVSDGLATEVGVSNFYEQHLKLLQSSIQAKGGSPVAWSQSYVDGAHHQKALVDHCQANSIQVMAYRPLAFSQVYQMIEPLAGVFPVGEQEQPESPQALTMEWLASRGISPVSSSADEGRMKANFEAGRRGEAANPAWASEMQKVFDKVAAELETIEMYGGVDECAGCFETMGAG